MADKNDFSEIITDILLELQKHSSVLRTVVDVQERMLTVQEQMQRTQEKILDRLDRNEAGFNAFAGTVLDHLGDIKSDLRGIRTTVFQDHEERLRRLEDFMRRAG
ncbi:hypothetical protein [Hymenobacter guriensis]|uniref:Uncharacterized protein n=1 Tax=Hymenobacter guriensis TaxID=2793065 RepID=A0ABS0L8A3_9BACT|nr:hypothetical protein [Hymenobacter guriensis]MBG8556355.1 hypothetical protein [Hymenobacter guriensis]